MEKNSNIYKLIKPKNKKESIEEIKNRNQN